MAQDTDTEKAASSSSRRLSELEEEDIGWHATSNLSDGTLIGRLGAYWYILDDDGRAISEGYHEITLNEDGGYEGKRSTRRIPIRIDTKPDRS